MTRLLVPILLSFTSVAFAAEAPPSPKWLKEITRVAYTDLPNGRKQGDWPERVIADFAAAGAQMMFSRVHSGESVPGLWWKSRHGAPDPAMGQRDGTREVVQLAHKHGLRYMAYYWAQKEPASLAAAHPDWQMRGAGGNPIGYFCMNTGYRDLVRDRIVELVKDYGVDGIFFDMFHAVGHGCYCKACKAGFKAESGGEPPAKEDFGNPLWARWVTFKHRTIESALLDFNRAIKAANPEAALVVNSWNAWVIRNPGNIRNSIRVAECVDGLLEETGWYDTVDPSFFAFPVLHNYMAWHLAGLCKGKRALMWSAGSLAGWLPNDATECTIRVMTILANGSVPAQSVPGRDVLRQYMAETARFDDVVRGAEPEPWCGLVVSEPSELWYGREDPKGRYLKGVYGAFQAMLERHLPVSLVTDRDLALGRLDGLKVLLMPNCAALGEKELIAVREFVRRGGGLVATYETSRYDEWGQAREGFGLADLFHAKSTGEFDSQRLFRGHDPKSQHGAHLYYAPQHRWSADPVIGRTLNRRGVTSPLDTLTRSVPVHCRSLLVEPVESPQSPLRVRTAVYNRKTEQVDRTDSPAAIETTFGKGRVIYFPSDLTWAIFRSGHEHLGRLLELTLRDAAAEPPAVEVAAPTIVQSMAYRQPNRLVVHLLNDISSLGRSQNVAGESVYLRREVIPISDLKVTFRDPGWKRFRQIPGGELKPVRTETGWQVTVPRLEIHAAVVAER